LLICTIHAELLGLLLIYFRSNYQINQRFRVEKNLLKSLIIHLQKWWQVEN